MTLKDFQCWTWKGTANNKWIVSRIGKDGLKNRVRELEQSMISRPAVLVSCLAPNAW